MLSENFEYGNIQGLKSNFLTPASFYLLLSLFLVFCWGLCVNEGNELETLNSRSRDDKLIFTVNLNFTATSLKDI